MVYLSRITTKAGDTGDTGLGDGSRLSKAHPRVAAIGDVDELNALLGLVRTAAPDVDLLRVVQNDLFDVGADLCLPDGPGLRVTAAQAEKLEAEIERLAEKQPPLKSFVLPGGSAAAAWLHLARTVCRRAERSAVALAAAEPGRVSPGVIVYLNRLSDLLFVLAREANAGGAGDVLWVPGGERQP